MPEQELRILLRQAGRQIDSSNKEMYDAANQFNEGGELMVFVSEYKIAPGSRNAAQERFKKSGGQPPKGVKLIARWHSAVGGRGVTVYEADDAQVIAAWAQQWSDVIHFDIYAAIDDAGFAKLLG